MRFSLLILLLLPVVGTADDGAFFETKVRPVLIERCHACHSAQAKSLKGDLRLDTKAGIRQGGSSGPVVVAGKPDESPLIHSIRRNHAEFSAMPPEAPLKPEEVAALTDWVKRGAFLPEDQVQERTKETIAQAKQRRPFTAIPSTVPVPSVRDGAWPKTAIDRFLLAALEAKNLHPVNDTDARTLIRRVTFDLTGLPPTAADVETFVIDHAKNSDTALAKLVDQLLADKAYGERWGRHWLDVVRYADTAGDNADFPIPQMHRYRNWVIDAVNADLPYTDFVKHQIAGDLIPGGTIDEQQARTVATGYLANARRFGSRVDDYPQHLTIEDTIDNLGRAFLGLTINCARCHDHKFDPVTMGDYYAVYGILNSTRYPWPGIELEQRQRDLVPLIDAQKAAVIDTDRNGKLKAIEKEIAELDKARKSAPASEGDAFKKKTDAKRGERSKILQGGLPYPTAYAMAEGKTIGDVPIQMKGDPTKPAAVAPRRFLEVLGGQALPPADTSSGRLALAEWITAGDDPLFARVMANRVWQHHFGRGLVATPNDFGKQGTPATHPELLDHLARAFITDGYSLKALHRRILLSRAYRLSSSEVVAGAETADPNNDLLGRFRVRRLDAEAIRDSLLFHAAKLDRTPGSEHPFPDPSKWNFTQHNPFRAVYDHNKRSVYLMTQRIQRHPYLAVFDGADTGAATGTRVISTTPLQALYFLNDPFVHEQAAGIAARLKALPASDRVDAAYRMLFGRPATDQERTKADAYLNGDNSNLDSLVRALLRLNEFVYVS